MPYGEGKYYGGKYRVRRKYGFRRAPRRRRRRIPALDVPANTGKGNPYYRA